MTILLLLSIPTMLFALEDGLVAFTRLPPVFLQVTTWILARITVAGPV
ncbi:MAG: hypothetical protein WHT09_11050 [Thermogutta sp.]